MNVSLTPELEKLVERKVSSGMYQTASEVVREGLRLLAERDKRTEALRKEIQKGLDAVERGHFVALDDQGIREVIARVKSDGRMRWEEQQARSRKR